MRSIWQDLRYATRVLAKSPGFAAVAVLTLALGIGANTAIFTVVYGVLLRPLPFPQPDRIVQLAEAFREDSDEMDLSWNELEHLREYGQLFEHIAGYTDVGFNLATGTEAEHVRGVPASAEYFQVLGVRPALGRDFLPEEDRGEGQRVAILSHELWLRRFGGEPGLIGRKILLSGDAYTVVGVMPTGFDPRANSELNPGTRADVWVPLALVAKSAGSGENLAVIARLNSTVTTAQLLSQMDVVTRDFRVRYPNVVGQELVMSFRPYQAMIGLGMRPFLLVLLGAIGFVLLIACANVANLFLARGSSRGREIAVRVAMGASRGRLIRQLLTESLLIALAGGALGLVVAYAGLSSLLATAPVNLPRVSDIRLDGWVFVFAFLISIATGAAFGVAPALYATKTNLNESLKEGEGRASAGAGRARLRQGLVIGELALSLVLLTGAGLMIATFERLMNTSPGFDPHHVLTMQFWMTGSKYASAPEVMKFYRAVEQRIEGLPGVTAGGVVAAGLPLERGGNNGVRIAGAKESEWINMDYREITPGYFQSIGTPLKQGRGITEADSEVSNPVVVINEAAARKYFPDRSSLGEHLYISGVLCEVVGVVGDVKSHLDQPAEPTTFVPAAQAKLGTSNLFEGWFPRSIVVRTTGDPLHLSQALREAVAATDPLVPTGAIRSMDQVLSRSLALRSFMMLLLGFFGGLALLLASVGIYGVIAFAVSQRTREIGVRMALGARPADVLRMVLREGMTLVGAGVVLGVAASLMLTRLLEGMVYGVRVRDPLIFAAVDLLLVAVSLVACYVPARRATRVDPLVALRYE
ncbi:MAG TPA: ABC transporter permease [Candidatus Acidoferrales bacterium]|nr:ABC transporter permease [Candidatus Acidoferrales bacterium]